MTILSFFFGEEMWEHYQSLGHKTNEFIRVQNFCYKNKIVYTNSPFITPDELPLFFSPRELRKLLKTIVINESQRDHTERCA